MKNVALAYVVALTLCPIAMGSDIAISLESNWWSQAAANREMQEIADNVTGASVEQFAAAEQAALATWVTEHTGDGVPDLLILCGRFPDSIYPAGNAQPDGSIAENFLDDGNTIINTGDWMFYVCAAGNNGAAGLQNMMDISNVTMSGGNDTAVTVTADGKDYTPSLQDLATDRPFHLDTLGGDWEVELVLAQNAAGDRADPVIVHNTVTNGRIGIFHQTNGQDNDPRGEVISEWINNWFIPNVAGGAGSPLARRPGPEDGVRVEQTWATLTWIPGYYAVSHDVYIGTNFDDVNDGIADAFAGNTSQATQVIGFPGFPFSEGLQPGTTYYWRIDEVNDANAASPWKGRVWSFWVPSTNAYDPFPSDGLRFIEADATLTWQPGLNAKLHTVYFGDNFDDVNNAEGGLLVADVSYTPGALESGKTYYWRVDESNPPITVKGDVWSFRTRPEIPVHSDPDFVAWWKFDENGGETALDWSGHGNHVTLVGSQWAEGVFGDSGLHIGYYGAIQNLSYAADDLTAVSVAAWIRTTSGSDQYIVSFDRNEYYRLEINGNGGGTGQVGWDVMTNSGQVDYGSVTRVDDGSWHHVAGVYDRGLLTIYIDGIAEPSATGGVTYGSGNTRFGFIGANSEATGFDGSKGSGSPVAGEVDDIRIYHRALTQQEIKEIMLRGDPLLAWDPSPADGWSTGINVASALTWSAGDEASQHDVYFGADRDAVADADVSDTTGVYQGRQSGTSYIPEGITMDSGPFYWRIDEVANDGTVAKGGVWNFSVADYVLVEDFESYNDIPAGEPGSNLVYIAWVDGFDNPNANGSTMGYVTGQSMETESVHSGNLSVALHYNNTTASVSEVVRTFTPAQDWTAHGVKTLSVWFAGSGANVPGQLYVKINGVRKDYSGGIGNLALAGWQPWNIDLTTVGANLSRVTSMAIGIQGAGASGTLLLDDIRIYAMDRETVTPVQPDPAGLVLHYAFDGNTNDSAGANRGTAFGGPTFTLGKIGQAINLDGLDDYVAIDNFSYASGGHTEITVSAWVRTAAETDQIIVSFDRNEYWRLEINGDGAGPGQVGWDLMTDTGQVDYGSKARVDDGQWHHLAGVFDNGTVTVYLDGNAATSATGGPTFGTGNPRFGYVGLGSESTTFNADPRTPASFVPGAIDDVRIYERALTHEEIAGLAGRVKPYDKPF